MKSPMENAGQNSCTDRPRLGVGPVDDDDRATAVADMPRVGDLARPNFVSLPAWFGCGQAAAVLRLKAMDYVLVSDERGARRVASLKCLATAPAERGLAACTTAFGPALPLATPADRALRMMDAQGSDHAGVVSGGLVVGILSREAAITAVLEARTRSRDDHQNGQAACRLAA